MSFEDFFSEESLKKIYNEKICYSTVVGIDKMNNTYFLKNAEHNLKKLSEKIHSGIYEFKPYKIILIPKDENAKPRKICIPTVSDRIVIEMIKNVVYYYYSDYHLNVGVSNTVTNFIECYRKNNYSNYIKTDLSSFFDNIDHEILLKKLSTRIKDERIIKLIEKILKNKQSYNQEKSSNLKNNLCGVPQGLSISTLLANIYMNDIDEKFNKIPQIKYFRYVDDIFIYCNNCSKFYYLKLWNELRKLKLKINKNKTSIKKLDNSIFEFLGYSITPKMVSVKKKSVRKLENSLEELFKNYYYSREKNIEELIWRINIRVSGAIAGNKRYGWLFYFKNITDLNLLYHLDYYIEKLKKRYKVGDIKTKTFARTYYKMQIKNLKKSKYFFNVDSVTDDEKRKILSNITNFSSEEINKLNLRELNYNFKKAIFKCLKSLEKDLDSIS